MATGAVRGGVRALMNIFLCALLGPSDDMRAPPAVRTQRAVLRGLLFVSSLVMSKDYDAAASSAEGDLNEGGGGGEEGKEEEGVTGPLLLKPLAEHAMKAEVTRQDEPIPEESTTLTGSKQHWAEFEARKQNLASSGIGKMSSTPTVGE